MSNDGALRAARQPSCPDYCGAGKKHRRQRRITASADGTRAALSLARGTSACPQSGSSENRLDDLFGKSARTFCRYLHRGRPVRIKLAPRFVPSVPRSWIRAEISVRPTGRAAFLRHYDVTSLGPLTRVKRSCGGHRQRTEFEPNRLF